MLRSSGRWQSGLLANWVDVCGKDAANIMAWGNTANWFGGYVTTQIMVWLQMKTGRWEFIFLTPMVLQAFTGMLYLKVCTVDTARDYVLKRKGLLKATPASEEPAASSDSSFDGVVSVPPDPVFFVSQQYKECTAKIKMNLGVGAYRTNEGKPLVLDVVKKAEQAVTDKLVDNKFNGPFATRLHCITHLFVLSENGAHSGVPPYRRPAGVPRRDHQAHPRQGLEGHRGGPRRLLPVALGDRGAAPRG